MARCVTRDEFGAVANLQPENQLDIYQEKSLDDDAKGENRQDKNRPDNHKKARDEQRRRNQHLWEPAGGVPVTQDCGSAPSSSRKRWVILLDIAADGQLANFGIESLKQLRNSACKDIEGGDKTEVWVAAQMTVDAPAGQKAIPRYIFGPGKKGERLSDFIAGRFDAPKTMTEQQALISFLQWATEHDDLKTADHYALILWGHGPQLLMQPPPTPGCQDISLYLTPGDLRDALEKVAVVSPQHKGIKFDLIGFDACSMSLFEVAYELREQVKYMVASQEEVPDLSFPYDTIVSLFRQGGDNVEKMLRQGVYKYIQTYIDYIADAVTEMMPATLTALRLANCGELEDALCELVRAFSKAEKKSGLAPLLIAARENTRDFVSGLYVDLADFAAELMNILNAGANTSKGGYGGQVPAPEDVSYWRYAIYKACERIIEALKEDTEGTHSSALVLANCSTDGACNGVSLYMPYLSNDQWIDMSRPMFKGGDPSRGGKDFSSVLNDVAPQQLLHARHTLIKNTESYYEDLVLSQDTGWYKFIVEQWTPILVRMASRDLNVLYSATQAARNVCRESKVRATPKCKELPF